MLTGSIFQRFNFRIIITVWYKFDPRKKTSYHTLVFLFLFPQFYALYKQATEGPCGAPKPGFWDVVGKAKW